MSQYNFGYETFQKYITWKTENDTGGKESFKVIIGEVVCEDG
jgi:hypothetical protein